MRAIALALTIACIGALWIILAFGLELGGAQGCRTVKGPGDSGVFVNLNDETSPESIDHTKDSIRAGQPRILHWEPASADAHRRAALRGIAKVEGKDLDEYPPAASREGGAGADVRAIDRSDNRSSGSRLGRVMSGYCSGQTFILEP